LANINWRQTVVYGTVRSLTRWSKSARTPKKLKLKTDFT